MKNYYEILEVSRNASPEVIEKAYKALVKKYHPDLQINDKSYFYENKMKDITEAYTILSDTASRADYDLKFKLYNKEEFSSTSQENTANQTSENSKQEKSNYAEKFNFKKYTSTIGQLLYNETKKDKKERSKDLKALLLTILIVSIIVFLCWKVPFLNRFFSP